jgi:hypothetical protein
MVKKEPAYATPLQVIAARKQARLQAATDSLKADPFVLALMNDFQAEILPDTITRLIEREISHEYAATDAASPAHAGANAKADGQGAGRIGQFRNPGRVGCRSG